MPTDDNREPTPGLNFILARFVAGLWQGCDQFAVPDAELLRAYGNIGADQMLEALGEGWGATRSDETAATTFTRIIPARTALTQLGF